MDITLGDAVYGIKQWFALCGISVVILGPLSVARAASCRAMAGHVPAQLEGWIHKVPLRSATGPKGLGLARLRVGVASSVVLHHTPSVHYVVEPDQPGGAVAYGGLAEVMVRRAGLYQVSLNSGAWIDMVLGDRKVASVAHGHGPSCTGIRKIVDFPLQRGTYVVQISANVSAMLDLMISQK